MEVEAVKRMCYHIIVIKHKELSGGRYQPVYMLLFLFAVQKKSRQFLLMNRRLFVINSQKHSNGVFLIDKNTPMEYFIDTRRG